MNDLRHKVQIHNFLEYFLVYIKNLHLFFFSSFFRFSFQLVFQIHHVGYYHRRHKPGVDQ